MSPSSRVSANRAFQVTSRLAERRASRVQGLPRPESRIFSSVSSATAKIVTSTKESANHFRGKAVSFLGGQKRANLVFGLTGGLVLAGLHSATGSQNEFYDYRFKLNKDADDLASFYGGEEFMELFCIFPFVGQIMMRSGYFDDEGNVITQGIPGTMKVSMVFSDEVDEASGKTAWFNKRERFRNTLFNVCMWDMVCNFGFRTLEDGTIEGYHVGEYFHGNLPVVSQIMKLVFKVHARWLAWSTEHHLNHYAFDAEEDWEEEMEIESRHNMPLFLLQNYAWKDLMGMFFGVEVGTKEDEEASFLLQRRPSFVNMVQDMVADAEEMEQKADEVDDAAVMRKKEADKLLPFQRRDSMVQIAADIAADRAAVKQLLARDTTGDDTGVVLSRQATEGGGVLARNATEGKGNFYSLAMEGAKARQLQRKESITRMNVAEADLQRRESSVALNIPLDQLKKSDEPAKTPAVAKDEETTGTRHHKNADNEMQEKVVADAVVSPTPSEIVSASDVAVAVETNETSIDAPKPVAEPVGVEPVVVCAQVDGTAESAPEVTNVAVLVPAVPEEAASKVEEAVVVASEMPAATPSPAAVEETPAAVAIEAITRTTGVVDVTPIDEPIAKEETNQKPVPVSVQAAKQGFQDNTEKNLLESKIAQLEASIEKKESALLKDKVARLEAIIENMQQSRV